MSTSQLLCIIQDIVETLSQSLDQRLSKSHHVWADFLIARCVTDLAVFIHHKKLHYR